MATDLQTYDESTWTRIREAVDRQYPGVSASELHSLHSLDRDTEQLITYVCDRTEAAREEVAAIISDAAQPSRFGHAFEATRRQVQQTVAPVRQQAQQGYQQVRQQIDEHPLGTSGVAFVTGIALGVLITLALVPQRPPASRWDRLREKAWRR